MGSCGVHAAADDGRGGCVGPERAVGDCRRAG